MHRVKSDVQRDRLIGQAGVQTEFQRGKKRANWGEREVENSLEAGWSISPAAVPPSLYLSRGGDGIWGKFRQTTSTFLELVDGHLQSRTPPVCP